MLFYAVCITIVVFTSYTQHAHEATGITTKYIQKGGSHCFKCSFEKSHWFWFWPGSLQLDINKGSTGSVVCVNNITDDHAGYYGCLSDKGVLFCWLLTIKEDPKNIHITNESTGGIMLINEGSPLILECTISLGKPAGMLRWKHKGIVLSSENCSGVLRLVIYHAVNQNGKVYLCEALNDQNETVLSRSITVLVKKSHEKMDGKINSLLLPLICVCAVLLIQVIVTLVLLIRRRTAHLQCIRQEPIEGIAERPMATTTEAIVSFHYDEIVSIAPPEYLSDSNSQYIDMQSLPEHMNDGTDIEATHIHLNSMENDSGIDLDGYLVSSVIRN